MLLRSTLDHRGIPARACILTYHLQATAFASTTVHMGRTPYRNSTLWVPAAVFGSLVAANLHRAGSFRARRWSKTRTGMPTGYRSTIWHPQRTPCKDWRSRGRRQRRPNTHRNRILPSNRRSNYRWHNSEMLPYWLCNNTSSLVVQNNNNNNNKYW